MKKGKDKQSIFSSYCVLLMKDLRQEKRTRDMLTSMGLYSVAVIMVFGIMFSQLGKNVVILDVAGGFVWVLIVFASLLGLGRSFHFEREQGCLDGMLLAPIDHSVIYLAKVTSNTLFLFAVELITLPLFWLFFLSAETLPDAFFLSIVPLVLGTVGIAAVGTLLATITVHSSGRDVLLAVLCVPVLFPLLYSCVAATSAVLTGNSGWDVLWFNGCVGAASFDVIMILVAWLLYDQVVRT